MALTSAVSTSLASFAVASTQTILVIDGDIELLGMMRAMFQLQRLDIIGAESAKEGRRIAQESTGRGDPPALAIVETSLPDGDGISLGRELLQLIPNLSLFFLTSCSQIEAKVRAMLMGADDYITKPFTWAELVARVERSLRRRQEQHLACLHIGGLEIDLPKGRVRIGEQELSLTMQEYRFLCCLARARGQVVSCPEIAEHLWPNGTCGNEEDLVKKVKLRLQAKLDKAASGVKVLHNVPRIGYYLEWKLLATD